MDAEIQRPGKANFGVLHCPNEALVQLSFTLLGLDFGIPAEMTGFARLYKMLRLERGND
jgi:hypothetical protein